jgi:hypothetical protein
VIADTDVEVVAAEQSAQRAGHYRVHVSRDA